MEEEHICVPLCYFMLFFVSICYFMLAYGHMGTRGIMRINIDFTACE